MAVDLKQIQTRTDMYIDMLSNSPAQKILNGLYGDDDDKKSKGKDDDKDSKIGGIGAGLLLMMEKHTTDMEERHKAKGLLF